MPDLYLSTYDCSVLKIDSTHCYQICPVIDHDLWRLTKSTWTFRILMDCYVCIGHKQHGYKHCSMSTSVVVCTCKLPHKCFLISSRWCFGESCRGPSVTSGGPHDTFVTRIFFIMYRCPSLCLEE